MRNLVIGLILGLGLTSTVFASDTTKPSQSALEIASDAFIRVINLDEVVKGINRRLEKLEQIEYEKHIH